MCDSSVMPFSCTICDLDISYIYKQNYTFNYRISNTQVLEHRANSIYHREFKDSHDAGE